MTLGWKVKGTKGRTTRVRNTSRLCRKCIRKCHWILSRRGISEIRSASLTVENSDTPKEIKDAQKDICVHYDAPCCHVAGRRVQQVCRFNTERCSQSLLRCRESKRCSDA